MKRMIVLFTILSGCFNGHRSLGEPDAGSYRPEGATTAIATVLSHYASEAGVRVTAEVQVTWRSDGFDSTRNGEFNSCSDIVVYDRNTRYEHSRSGLAHMLAHCVVGDFHHTDDYWWGEDGYVDSANWELAELGL